MNHNSHSVTKFSLSSLWASSSWRFINGDWWILTIVDKWLTINSFFILYFCRVLVQLVNRFGLKKWSQIAKYMKGRIGKQCRERWNNHLRPDIKVTLFSNFFSFYLFHIQLRIKWHELWAMLILSYILLLIY